MDTKMEAIFAPLRASLVSRSLTDIDMLELIGGFISHNPVFAQALTYHARDIIEEHEALDQTADYGEIIAEMYRRTFFDRPYADMYGTGQMLDMGEEVMKEFVNHLIVSEQMDRAQVQAGSFVQGNDNQH